MKNNIQVITQHEGQFLAVAGGNYRIVVSGTDTNGAYAVIEMHVPPGGGPPPHAHPKIQEMFFLLEGELEFKTEAGKTIVKKGGFVNIPFDGDVHCFKNISSANAVMLCTVVPAGLEEVFALIGEPVKEGEFLPFPQVTPERRVYLKEINEKYGQTMFPPDYLDNV